MKISSLFWGALLIVFGVMLLLYNTDVLEPVNLGILNFWPIILVIWGVSLLKLPKYAKGGLAILSGVFVSLLLLDLFFAGKEQDIVDFDDDFEFKIESETDSTMTHDHELLLDSGLLRATVEFDGGAGEFGIIGTTKKLVKIDSKGMSPITNYKFTPEDSSAWLEIDFDHGDQNISNLDFDRSARIRMNPEIIWNLEINLGATEFDADLSDFNTPEINLKSGAADIEMIIGDKADTTNIYIKSGASNIELYIPKKSGCSIRTKTGLSNRQFKDFLETGDGNYITPDFDSAKKFVFITFKGGLSNFKVRRK